MKLLKISQIIFGCLISWSSFALTSPYAGLQDKSGNLWSLNIEEEYHQTLIVDDALLSNYPGDISFKRNGESAIPDK